MNKQLTRHNFLLLQPSVFPIAVSFSLLTLICGALFNFSRSFFLGGIFIHLGGFFLIISLLGWWRQVMVEAYDNLHTPRMQTGIRIAMCLFILSELMFFVGFFWAFFHSAIVPDTNVGSVWPPLEIEPIGPWGLPLFNTIALLSSGGTITWAHHLLLKHDTEKAAWLTLATLFLAICFLCAQYHEYVFAEFSYSDGIYGSLFYMLTGFHGLHVTVGFLFLLVVWFRLDRSFLKNFFTPVHPDHHVLFEISAWYWHFVDVVWIFLFVFVYWWGSTI